MANTPSYTISDSNEVKIFLNSDDLQNNKAHITTGSWPNRTAWDKDTAENWAKTFVAALSDATKNFPPYGPNLPEVPQNRG